MPFVRVAGAPTRFLADISKDEALKLILVLDIGDPYETAILTSDDYPGLIPLDDELATISVSSVLMAYNHPKDTYRHKRVNKLAKLLEERIDEFKQGVLFIQSGKKLISTKHWVIGFVGIQRHRIACVPSSVMPVPQVYLVQKRST